MSEIFDCAGMDIRLRRSTAEPAFAGMTAKKQVIQGVPSGAPSDFQEPYLRQLFGFLGITQVEFVRAEGVGLSPRHRADALATAHASIGEPLRAAA